MHTLEVVCQVYIRFGRITFTAVLCVFKQKFACVVIYELAFKNVVCECELLFLCW